MSQVGGKSKLHAMQELKQISSANGLGTVSMPFGLNENERIFTFIIEATVYTLITLPVENMMRPE